MKDFIFTSSFGHSWHQFPFNKDLEKFALKLEKNFPSIVRSNHNGYHSDYLDIHVPLIKKFYDAIKPAVYDYTKSLNIEKPYDLHFNKPWFNVNRKGASNMAQNHPGNFLAATYYVKTPPRCGDLCFISPRCPNLFNIQYSTYTNENSSFWKVAPKEGKLIIFPADILHSVETNQSIKPRISLSFNINIQQGN